MLYDFQELARAVRFVETERRMVAAWGRGRATRGLLFRGYRISVWEGGESSGEGWWTGLRHRVNVLHAAEL